MGNLGADDWAQYLRDLQAGNISLSNRPAHDYEWSVAEQASTESRLNTQTLVCNNSIYPSNQEKIFYNFSNVWRWLLRNETAIYTVLQTLIQQNVPGASQALQLLQTHTDVTNDRTTYTVVALAWFTSALFNIYNDYVSGNYIGIPGDVLNLVNPCGLCSGGGRTPAALYSVYDHFGGGAFRSEWESLGGAGGALGDPVSNWYSISGGQQ